MNTFVPGDMLVNKYESEDTGYLVVGNTSDDERIVVRRVTKSGAQVSAAIEVLAANFQKAVP